MIADASTMTTARDLLIRQSIFASLSSGWIDELLRSADRRELSVGEVLVMEGATPATVFVVLEGVLEIARQTGPQDVVIATRGPGELVGEMGLLAGTPRNATVRARERTVVLSIDGVVFMDALRSSADALLVVLRTTVGRLQSAEAELVQHQKMSALGILAAGLTHELNNPAAALARSAGQLRDAVAGWEAAARRLGESGLPRGDLASLDTLRQDIAAHAVEPVWLDPIVRSDREQQVQVWLQRHGVDDAWKLAPTLVDAGWDVEYLRQIDEFVSSEGIAAVVEWMSSGQLVLRLLHQLTISAHAISEIVGAVKAYTRLDQAPIQNVDLHEGIEQSLTILSYKLRGVRVRREYTTALPGIEAYASELNQVWTNLIDNAADAMDGDGDLTIRTSRNGSWIVVEIIDSGPGISETIRQHLFEPFFTTKPQGRGTGMGLSITYSIIRKHHGEISVESRPGCTAFVVRIPVSGVSN